MIVKRIVDGSTEEGAGYLIQPQHINTKDRFWGAFHNDITASSARVIVELCQKMGGWMPFTQAEIDAYSKQSFWFNLLNARGEPTDNHNYVILGEDGKYRVTHDFIAICFRSSPAI